MSSKYHSSDMEMYGCFSCMNVGGEYEEKVGGDIQCKRCGEFSVVSFSHALGVMQQLSDVELLNEYNELVEHFGILRFDDDDDGFDPEEY